LPDYSGLLFVLFAEKVLGLEKWFAISQKLSRKYERSLILHHFKISDNENGDL
jgi:hypothetical protein